MNLLTTGLLYVGILAKEDFRGFKQCGT